MIQTEKDLGAITNMSNKRTLVECFGLPYNAKTITEAHKNDSPVILDALLQRSDTPNSNRRIYPKKILEREIEKYKSLIAAGQSGGEVDHPSNDSPVVELKNVGIAIRDIWWDGNDVKGKVEILHKVPAGKILIGLMESNMSIGLSSRAIGSTTIRENDIEEVGEDLCIISWDAVSIGSVVGAGFLREGKDAQKCLVEGFSLDHYLSTSETKNAPKSKYASLNNILNDILK